MLCGCGGAAGRCSLFPIPVPYERTMDETAPTHASLIAYAVALKGSFFGLWHILILSGAAAQLRYIQDGTPAHGLLCGGD